MALLTVNTIPTTSAVTALVAVSTSDTISATDIGERGVIIDINNGSATSDVVTVSDPGTTDAGNPAAGAATTITITASSRRRVVVTKWNVNLTSGLATITHSTTTTVTAEVFRY